MTRTLADQRAAGPDDAVVVAAAPSGDVLFSNRVARQVVGRRLQDLAAEFPLRHLDGRAYTASEWPLARSLGGEEVIDDRFVRVAPDGSRSLFRCSSWPAYDRDGRVVAAVAVTRNVSEERDREDRLTYLAGLLEHSDDAIVALDAGRHVTLWNNGAERMYGWAADEVMGRHVTEVAGFQMGDEQPAQVPRTVAEQERRRDQSSARRKDGTPVTVELMTVALHTASGELSGFLGIHRDAATRVRAEQAVADAHRRSETILENISQAFFGLDHDWRFTYLNRRAVDAIAGLIGEPLAREDLLGRTVWERLPGIVGTASEASLRRAARDRTAIMFNSSYPPADRCFEVHVHPVEDGLAVYFRDITERKRLEAERDRRARQQALVAELGQRALARVPLQQVMDEAVDIVGRALDAAPVGIAELLPGGELLLLRAGVGWKDAVGSATGPAGADSLVGYTAASGEPMVSEDLAADSRFRISTFLAGQTAASAAAVAIAGAAEPFGVLAAFCRERRAFSADDVTFLHGVANVISSAVERVASEQRILEVRAAERRRIARDLHDEALQDLTDALLVVTAGGDSTDPAAAARLVPALNRVGQQLRGAIYDLRLGGEEDRPFGELLRHLVDLQREMSSAYEIELQISTAAPVGPLGKTGTEVLRVVREALVNARRHSGARHVRVRASGSRSELRVEVEDDGRGFDVTAKPESGITGMRERAALYGSELEIRAQPGRGTLVGLTVPVDGADGQAAGQVRVLLVEDHAAVRQAIAATFAREPHFAVTRQAASMAEARRMLHDVDVAVIDLGLPDGYGGDLIKELQAVNPQAQALVLSASLDRADLARAVESGAAGTLDKTARLDEVVDAVRRLQTGESLLPVDEVVALLRFAGRRREDERDDRQAVDRLTAREREVLQALADGLDSQAIADRLHITIRTERNHIANILAKLGVHSQLQALVFALRYDLVEIR